MRPPPRLIGFSDCTIKVIVSCAYAVGIIAASLVWLTEQIVLSSYSTKEVSSSGPCNSVFVLITDTFAPYVGISFENGSDTRIKEALPIEVEVLGIGCTEYSWGGPPGPSYRRDVLTKVEDGRIALIHPVTCTSYQIVLDGHCSNTSAAAAAKPRGLADTLLVETQLGAVAWAGYWTRVAVAVVFLVLTAVLAVQWGRAMWTRGAPVGSRSIVLGSFSMICMCDPVDLLSCYGWVPNLGLYALRLVGVKLLLFWPPHFVGEVLADLNQRAKPRIPVWNGHRSRLLAVVCHCRCSTFFSYRCFVAVVELAFLAYLIFVAVLLSVLIQDASSGQDCVTCLAEHWTAALRVVLSSDALFLYAPQMDLLAAWTAFRLCELIFSLRSFPYSICRVHHIVAAWSVMTLVLTQLLAAPLFLATMESRRRFEHEPWYRLNSQLLGLVLPGATNARIVTVACSALYVLLLAVSFGPYVDREEAPSSRSPATAGDVEDLNAVGSHEPRVSIAPVQETSMAERVSSMTSHVARSMGLEPRGTGGGRSTGRLTAGSAAAPLNDGAAADATVTLSIVRILAHCSYLVYDEDLSEPILQSPAVPAHEGDLALNTLRLRQVLCGEEADTRALVATAQLEASGGRQEGANEVCILAFRGTNSRVNIRTDLRMRLAEAVAPNTAALARERRVKGVRVHEGFQAAMLTMREDLLRILTELRCKTVWVTGHSLGAALATLVAVELHLALHQQQVGIALCTFGSPRVGNGAFARLFRYSACQSVRVVVDTDPVPSFLSILRPCFEYEHVSGLVRVFRNGHLVSRPTFLEETLLWLVQHTFLPRVICWCCIFLCCRSKEHMMANYIAALHAAQWLEGGSQTSGSHTSVGSGGWLEARVGVPIETSFVQNRSLLHQDLLTGSSHNAVEAPAHPPGHQNTPVAM